MPLDLRKIRIAIIGCGRISKNHIKSIYIHKNLCELVAICDNNLKRLDEATKIKKNEINVIEIIFSFEKYSTLYLKKLFFYFLRVH